MLDGLLGRSGFYTKSKSLIKQTRTRIDVVRRKRGATQKFLRKDVADLLSSGLETNAFGRAEGLVAELVLTSCYEFIDHVCELILKHLPVLQKLRECPEDCREAVASVMFAAARFSDLPELRELRDIFKERYGSSLEHFVNQKLVENIAPKPPSKEKKIQLMEEIALEYSIPWDSKGFEERMSNPSPAQQSKNRSPATVHAAENKPARPLAEGIVHNTFKNEVSMKKRSETTHQNTHREVDGRPPMVPGTDFAHGRREELKHNVFKVPPEPTSVRHRPPPSFREEAAKTKEDNEAHLRKRDPKALLCGSEEDKALESVDTQHKLHRRREDRVPAEKHPFNSLSHQQDVLPVKNGPNFSSSINNDLSDDIQARSTSKGPEDAKLKDGPASNFKGAIPPPYVKPSRSNRHRSDHLGSSNLTKLNVPETEDNDTLTFNKPQSNTEKSENAAAALTEPEDGPVHYTAIYYKDEVTPATSRRRSHRRKHSRSKSTHEDAKLANGEDEERVIRLVSTSRRKHGSSRHGLQILFDDEHHSKKTNKDDEEERMIDKMLLHYSKKPSSSADPNNPRHRKTTTTTHKPEDDHDSTPTTSRSMSLPPVLQMPEPEPPKKVFARAASFQQDSSPAKHVHPKLPDYDDLAARFAALRSNKG